MTKEKFKTYLDFLPLVVITGYALHLLYTVATTNIVLVWQHKLGLMLLPVNYALFRWRHKAGVIGLGITLLLGLAVLLSYTTGISTATFTIGKNADSQFTIFYGQPMFLLWLLVHFIISGRHYVGIVTKRYWAELLGKPAVNVTTQQDTR